MASRPSVAACSPVVGSTRTVEAGRSVSIGSARWSSPAGARPTPRGATAPRPSRPRVPAARLSSDRGRGGAAVAPDAASQRLRPGTRCRPIARRPRACRHVSHFRRSRRSRRTRWPHTRVCSRASSPAARAPSPRAPEEHLHRVLTLRRTARTAAPADRSVRGRALLGAPADLPAPGAGARRAARRRGGPRAYVRQPRAQSETRRGDVVSPRSGPGQSRGDPPVTPFGLATIVASVAFVVAGIALPEVAESLLRLMIATFAFGFVLSRVYRAGLPERTTTDEYSPFRGPAGARESATAPRVLRDLASKLAAADEPRSAKRCEIPRTFAGRWSTSDAPAGGAPPAERRRFGRPREHPIARIGLHLAAHPSFRRRGRRGRPRARRDDERARPRPRRPGETVKASSEIHALPEAFPVERAADAAQRLLAEVEKAVIGQRAVLEIVLAGLLADGHVLLDDVPGVAKTLMARSFATAAGLHFSRVQFTPDVLPADIAGATVLDLASNTPTVPPRAPSSPSSSSPTRSTAPPPRRRRRCSRRCRRARSRSDGDDAPRCPRPSSSLATQNPIESEGTYPLPEAQLDRFILRTTVGYPARLDEVELLSRRLARKRMRSPSAGRRGRGVPRDQASLEEVHVTRACASSPSRSYATRRDGHSIGSSPRGSLALIPPSRARSSSPDATSSRPTTCERSPCPRSRTASFCARGLGEQVSATISCARSRHGTRRAGSEVCARSRRRDHVAAAVARRACAVLPDRAQLRALLRQPRSSPPVRTALRSLPHPLHISWVRPAPLHVVSDGLASAWVAAIDAGRCSPCRTALRRRPAAGLPVSPAAHLAIELPIRLHAEHWAATPASRCGCGWRSRSAAVVDGPVAAGPTLRVLPATERLNRLLDPSESRAVLGMHRSRRMARTANSPSCTPTRRATGCAT